MEINKDNLHHAYLVIGDSSSTKKFLEKIFHVLSFETSSNPDYFYFPDNIFGIDESRALKERAYKKAFGTRKIFVINSEDITAEAQNALLKVFEEPPINTHFFILREKPNLLPTLLSRMVLISEGYLKEPLKEAETFLNGSIAERLSFIKEKIEDDNFPLSSFLEGLAQFVNEKGKRTEAKKIFKFIKYADDRGRNARLILEHLALVLPQSLE